MPAVPGLSSDPDKRQRQLEALASGRRAQAERLLASNGSATAKPRHEPASPGIPVADYDEDHEPEEPHGRQAEADEPAGGPAAEPERRDADVADIADIADDASGQRAGGFLGGLREGLGI